MGTRIAADDHSKKNVSGHPFRKKILNLMGCNKIKSEQGSSERNVSKGEGIEAKGTTIGKSWSRKGSTVRKERLMEANAGGKKSEKACVLGRKIVAGQQKF